MIAAFLLSGCGGWAGTGGGRAAGVWAVEGPCRSHEEDRIAHVLTQIQRST